jgi:hypothetical protein
MTVGQIPQILVSRVGNLSESELQVQGARHLKAPDAQPDLELFRTPHAVFLSRAKRSHSCLAAEATIDPKFAFQKLAYDVLLSPPASKPPITPSR